MLMTGIVIPDKMQTNCKKYLLALLISCFFSDLYFYLQQQKHKLSLNSYKNLIMQFVTK